MPVNTKALTSYRRPVFVGGRAYSSICAPPPFLLPLLHHWTMRELLPPPRLMDRRAWNILSSGCLGWTVAPEASLPSPSVHAHTECLGILLRGPLLGARRERTFCKRVNVACLLAVFCVQGIVLTATRNERPSVLADVECLGASCDPRDFPLIKLVCFDRKVGVRLWRT